ncbi:hypothetical protein KI387_005899, partial [Taxus chinensis]
MRQIDGVLDFNGNHDDVLYMSQENMEGVKAERPSVVEGAKTKEGELLLGSPRTKTTILWKDFDTVEHAKKGDVTPIFKKGDKEDFNEEKGSK